jgi:hypothetical protein
MYNCHVAKKSTPAIIQTYELKTMEEMALQLPNMLCIWLMKNYQIKTNAREIVVKVLDSK